MPNPNPQASLINDIPDFAEALTRFRSFTEENGIPSELLWVFRDDVWELSPTAVWVKYASSPMNVALAEKVFAEGRERGLVEIHAVAIAGDKIAAVWFPKYAHEEVQGWSEGMKLSISQPLPRAKTIGVLAWSLLGFRPRFRQYQKEDRFIGTVERAAA
jgi:hypothetical protein